MQNICISKAINLVKKSKYPHDMFNDELVLNLTLVCFGKFKHLNKTHLFRLIGHEKIIFQRIKIKMHLIIQKII